MRTEKYIIIGHENETLALKRLPTGKTVLGGNARFIELMEQIMNDCFEVDRMPHERYSSASRLRYSFHTSMSQFKVGLFQICEGGLSYRKVSSHQRIMR